MRLSLLRVYLAFCGVAWGFITCQGAGPPGTAPTEEDIRSVMDKANDNPEALLQLKGAPLKWTFDYLFDLTNTRGNVQTPSLLRRAELANEILFQHPDLERYLTTSLNEVTDFYNRKPSSTGRKMDDAEAMNIATYYTMFAERIPGPAAFRIVGPFLFSKYFPKIDEVDSPAEWGRSTLARLAKARLGETIPRDMEGARKWWTENAHRFAPEANVAPSSAPAPSVGAPAAASSTAPASNATLGPNSAWAMIAVVAAALAVLIGWLFRRKHQIR